MKIFNNKKIKFFTTLIILLFFYVFISAYFYVSAISNDLSDTVFRLHVIANSNSDEDQNLKYIVRDSLINYMNTLCCNSSSKEETIRIVSEHLNDFENIANETIKENGFSYVATVEIGNFEFPTKSYADITFPAGFYDALRVKIGNANGKNWWCVLYPSLCFIDTTSGFLPDESKVDLQNTLSDEEYKIISDKDDMSINFKFKFIEFFNKNNLLMSKQN